MDKITFIHHEIPPSINKLYFHRQGRRILSKEGRAFKNRFVSNRGGLSAIEIMSFKPDHGDYWNLEIWFYIHPDRLFNMNYGTDGRVKSPFKDIDGTNLIKVTEDAISELIGIKDRANFTVTVHKFPAEEERLEAVLTRVGNWRDICQMRR